VKLSPPEVTELLTAQKGPSVRAKVVFNSHDGTEGIIVQLQVEVAADESLESIKSRAIARAKSLLAVETSEPPEPEVCMDIIDDLSFEP